MGGVSAGRRGARGTPPGKELAPIGEKWSMTKKEVSNFSWPPEFCHGPTNAENLGPALGGAIPKTAITPT
jgi:hypothetical protein